MCEVGASWTHTLANGIRVVGSKGTAEARFTLRDEVIVRQSLGDEHVEFRVLAGGSRNNVQLLQPLCGTT